MIKTPSLFDLFYKKPFLIADGVFTAFLFVSPSPHFSPPTLNSAVESIFEYPKLPTNQIKNSKYSHLQNNSIQIWHFVNSKYAVFALFFS